MTKRHLMVWSLLNDFSIDISSLLRLDESIRSQQQSNTQQTNLHGTNIIYPPAPFAEVPIACTCIGCQKRIVTRTEKVTGTLTWVIAGVLCWFGCIPCCLIPFCVDSCKVIVLSCTLNFRSRTISSWFRTHITFVRIAVSSSVSTKLSEYSSVIIWLWHPLA